MEKMYDSAEKDPDTYYYLYEYAENQLDGRSRKVKMIEILLRELEPEDKSVGVMRRYIKERAEEVKVCRKAGKSRKDVQELIAKFISSEELLNVISDRADLGI